MRIIVDADACPRGVKAICREVAQRYNLLVMLVADTAHDLESDVDDDVEIITVEQGRDASDYRIAALAEPQDIVITNDYGLAAIVVDRVTAVLNPSGFVYSAVNMDELLYRRYLSERERKAGRGTKIKKRTGEDDLAFKGLLLTYVAPVKIALS